MRVCGLDSFDSV